MHRDAQPGAGVEVAMMHLMDVVERRPVKQPVDHKEVEGVPEKNTIEHQYKIDR